MMQGRMPTIEDMRRMSKAVAYVTSYDLGTDISDFKHFVGMVGEESEPQAMLHALAQFSWLLLQSLEEVSGSDREEILQWYGRMFAIRAEELE